MTHDSRHSESLCGLLGVSSPCLGCSLSSGVEVAGSSADGDNEDDFVPIPRRSK